MNNNDQLFFSWSEEEGRERSDRFDRQNGRESRKSQVGSRSNVAEEEEEEAVFIRGVNMNEDPPTRIRRNTAPNHGCDECGECQGAGREVKA